MPVLSELRTKKRISGKSGAEILLSLVRKLRVLIPSRLSVDEGKFVFVLKARSARSWGIEGGDSCVTHQRQSRNELLKRNFQSHAWDTTAA
jgi:hypothetical protein